ncbi:MAG: protein kinase [Gammaproteobacteria bacterium]|nr:protein kinase [Gammaproteobacteria bacterium]
MIVAGNTVGRYEIRELLGTGAMAEVYKAYDPQIGRIGAIKILKDSLIDETEYLNRFLKEASAAGTLNHPNIVTVYDVGKVNDLPYILMELVGGETLADVLDRKDQLSHSAIIEIAMQIASALDCAHNANIVHRDIKPENILYDAEKNNIKVADFGIAKQEDSDIAERTQVGTILGTPRYMSPEQARGEVLDGRSDLFSLGVILYELLTGRKAFDGQSMATLTLQILQEDPPSLRECAPGVPSGLQSIINGLLNKKVAKRFKNGRELYEALGKELRTLQDQQDEQSYLPMQVRWTGIMGAVVGLVMIISVVMVFNVQRKLLTEQAISAGVSLATFIASESAIHLLGEDWIGLDTLTDEAFKRKSFAALTIVDLGAVVRSSTDKSLVGKPWTALDSNALLSTRQDVRIFEAGEGASSIYTYDSPIHFNDTHIGNIKLSVSQGPLANVMSVTRRVLLLLGISVTLVVLLAAYLLNRLVARNLLLVTRAIKDYASGNYSARVSRRWKNEFGALASAFNAMAEKLQFEVHSEHPEAGSGPALAGAEAARETLDSEPEPEPEPEPEDGDDAAIVLLDGSDTDDIPLDDATIIQIRPES